mmetsp:Transcript_32646/g.63047  ORF Transcript_32646/g.63047 Transcript_32646/m.63047 type:complete len:126 (+) Transcript_32646:1-378(+)
MELEATSRLVAKRLSAVDILAAPRGQRYADRPEQPGFHNDGVYKEAQVRRVNLKLAAKFLDKVNHDKPIQKESLQRRRASTGASRKHPPSWKDVLAAEGNPVRRESVREFLRRARPDKAPGTDAV